MPLPTRTVETARIATAVREGGRHAGEPVLLVHGNVSSSVFWEDTLAALPDGFRGLAPDLRGYGDSEPAPIDATRGLRDFSDDLRALVDALDLGRVHLVGWSMGGGVAMQYLLDHPGDVASLTLVSPVSPYGFGATRADGSPVAPDGAGSGAGTVNPDFVAKLRAGDLSDDPASARGVMRMLYFADPPAAMTPEREDEYVAAMVAMRVGDDHYPGTSVTSSHWPMTAPGPRGILNTMAPTYCDLTGIVDVPEKPPVLWVRGTEDKIVSDASLVDLGVLGAAGAVPGWPGEDAFPAQPMVSQTRSVLERYRDAGGSFREVAFDGVGHSPHLERPAEFDAELARFLAESARSDAL